MNEFQKHALRFFLNFHSHPLMSAYFNQSTDGLDGCFWLSSYQNTHLCHILSIYFICGEIEGLGAKPSFFIIPTTLCNASVPLAANSLGLARFNRTLVCLRGKSGSLWQVWMRNKTLMQTKKKKEEANSGLPNPGLGLAEVNSGGVGDRS